MKEKFLKAVEIFKEKTRKECYKIVLVDGEPSITDNKLGGTPYLPIGCSYPLDSDGNPMGLILQVDLKEVDLEGYPKVGILQVYADAKGNWPMQYEIKYLREGQEYRTDLPTIDDSSFYIVNPRKIKLEKAVAYMSFNDYRFFDIFCPILNEVFGTDLKNYGGVSDYFEENGFDEWVDVLLDNIDSPSACIGGYPDFTQDDPRPLDRDLEECLFKLDSVLSFDDIYIGDSGIMFCFISKKDIETCNFENAFLDWDCC